MNDEIKPTETIAAPRAKRGIPRTSLATAETYAHGVWDAGRLGPAPDVSVARAIGGPEAKATGSGWRAKVAALRVFGLIERTEGHIKLSDIGHAVVKDTDPEAQRKGRRQAVLQVEPYATVLSQSAGHTLPPALTLAGRWEHEFGLSRSDAASVADAFFESVKHAELIDAEGVVRLDAQPVAETTTQQTGLQHGPGRPPAPLAPPAPVTPAANTPAATTLPLERPVHMDADRTPSTRSVGIAMTIDMSKWPVEDILRVLNVFGYSAPGEKE